MANPIAFKVVIDPREELRRQLQAAPEKHGEAILVAFETLQTAHDNGTLDLIQGLVGGRDVIAGKLAEYAKLPGGIAAIRNLLAASKILMALDPDTLDEFTKSLVTATGLHKAESVPPSLFAIGARVFSKDSRRALSFLTHGLEGIGKALAASPESVVDDQPRTAAGTGTPKDNLGDNLAPIKPLALAGLLLGAATVLVTARRARRR